MNKILIKNGNVVIFDDDIKIENADILINGTCIEKIEKQMPVDKDCYVLDASNKIVMPGFINAHTHVGMSIFRGTYEGLDLTTWLNEKIWPKEAMLNSQDIYYTSMLSFIEQISTGTTCTNDHYFFPEATIKAALDMGIRLVSTRVLMDVDGKGEQRLNEFKNLYNLRDTNQELITYTVSPHGLYTCTPEYLDKVSDIALKYNLPVHVHFLESINEIEDIKKLHGKEAIEVLKQYFSNTHNILAHGVKLGKKEIEEIKKMDCGIAHNPVSNMMLGCKIADITNYLDDGINVALGTDGQGSGNNLDMFQTMMLSFLLQGGIHENEKRISTRQALKMATINGAKLLNLENKIGSIKVGKKADIIIVNQDESLDNITSVPNLDKVANLVYNTKGSNVETTIVNGKIIMENRQIKNIDVEKIIFECKKIIERLKI